MSPDIIVYIGTYTEPIRFGTGKILEGKGKGIHRFRLDQATGALEPMGKATAAVNPSYLAPDARQRFLYAVNELKTYEERPGGSVSAFAIKPGSGELELLNRQPTFGGDPCHVLVDERRRHLFVANFMTGSVAVYPIRGDGSLGEASDFVQHLGSGIDPVRQAGPHAHSVTLDPAGRFAFVPDLGLDRLMIYRFDAGRGLLEPGRVPWIKMKPGAGPRHLAFQPGGGFAWLVNELDSTVAALAYDRRSGTFRLLQTVPTLPEGVVGESTCADIHASPDGRFVYASNRGHDSIAAWRVHPRKGTLDLVGHRPSGGRTPRNFAIDPTGRFLLVANQDSDTVVTFRLDPRNGKLRPTGQVAEVPTPVCIRFVVPGREKRRGKVEQGV
jgi:6-phosphogluconolactonase